MSKPTFDVTSLQHNGLLSEFLNAFWEALLGDDGTIIKSNDPKGFTPNTKYEVLNQAIKNLKKKYNVAADFEEDLKQGTDKLTQKIVSFLDDSTHACWDYRTDLHKQRTSAGFIELDDSVFWPEYQFNPVNKLDDITETYCAKNTIYYELIESKSNLEDKPSSYTFKYKLKTPGKNGRFVTGEIELGTIKDTAPKELIKEYGKFILDQTDDRGHTYYTPNEKKDESFGAYVLIKPTQNKARKNQEPGVEGLVYVTQYGHKVNLLNSYDNPNEINSIKKMFQKNENKIKVEDLKTLTELTHYDRKNNLIHQSQNEILGAKLGAGFSTTLLTTVVGGVFLVDPSKGISFTAILGALISTGALVLQTVNLFMDYHNEELDFPELLIHLSLAVLAGCAGFFLCKFVLLPLIAGIAAGFTAAFATIGTVILVSLVVSALANLSLLISRRLVPYLANIFDQENAGIPGKEYLLTEDQRTRLKENGYDPDVVQMSLFVAGEVYQNTPFLSKLDTLSKDLQHTVNSVRSKGKLGNNPLLMFAPCRLQRERNQEEAAKIKPIASSKV